MNHSWTQRLRRKTRTSKPYRQTRRYRPRLDPLEDRRLPSSMVFTVNSAGDDPFGATAGVVTLRDAINDVNHDALDRSSTPDVINFAIGAPPTISLSADLPAINNPVTIDGSTQPGVTVNGNGFAMLVDNSTATANGVTFNAGTVSIGAGAALTVGASSTVNATGDLDAGVSAILRNYGSLSVSGNFVGSDSTGVYNAPFSTGTTTSTATFTVGGAFTAGDDSFLYNNGTASFSVTKGFTLGDYGFVYNGLTSTDAATLTVGGSLSIGADGFVFQYGKSALNATGDFTLGDFGILYNGNSSADAATLTVGGSLSIGDYGFVDNYGTSALKVTGDFTLGDGGELSNGNSSTDAATLSVGGNFTIGSSASSANENVNNEGTSTFTVHGDFALLYGVDGFAYVYNGVSSTDDATLTVDGNFSIGSSSASGSGSADGFTYNYGASTLSVGGDFTIYGDAGSFLYNGTSNSDNPSLTVGGGFSLGANSFVYTYGTKPFSVTGSFTLGDNSYFGDFGIMSVAGNFDPGTGNPMNNDTVAGTFTAASGSNVTTNAATWQVLAGGQLNVAAGATFDVASGGTLMVDGGVVTGVTVTDGGTGYTSPPAVTFSGSGTGAAGVATIAGGVSAVTVTGGGSNYFFADVSLFGDGTGATAVATVSGGVVTGVTITNPGSGYTSAPFVYIYDPYGYGFGATGAATISGAVTGVTITNAGSGYTSPPSVGFAGGGGTDAAGTAAINTTGGAIVTDQGRFDVEGTLASSRLSTVVVEENGQLSTQGGGQLNIQGTLLTWNNPADIRSSTALGAAQLDATASSGGSPLSGTFTYTLADDTTPANGAMLNLGNDQTLNVTFTPNDTADYSTASAHVSINVVNSGPVTPMVVVNPVPLTYGTALAISELSGTAIAIVGGNPVAVAGTYSYTSAAGTVLHAGSGQSEAVTFTPTDTTDYTTATAIVTVNVAQATPTVTSVSSVPLTYGTALANGQLSGTATWIVGGNPVTVAGTFSYTSAAGTVLHAGSGQSEAVTFTPTDTTDYTTATAIVTVNVAQATPTVTSVSSVPLTYGTALANGQLSGTATWIVGGNPVTVAGTFSYTSAAGTVLHAGSGQSEAVTFTPTDTTEYTTASSTVTVNVAQATPTMTSVNSVPLTYGTALANGQLSGTATWIVGGNPVTVAGTFSYTSAAGTVLHAGSGQSEAVTFTPTDTTDYTNASATVTVNVSQATPAVTGVNPVPLTYGTALANGQLSGTATWIVGGNPVTVAGTFSYTSAGGTVLHAGSGQTEAVTFTPTDTTDYTNASATVTVNVAQATPTVTWNTPGPIAYFMPLGSNQLDAVASLPGTIVYTPAAGTLLPAGTQTLSAKFTPTDSTDYKTATVTVPIVVLGAGVTAVGTQLYAVGGNIKGDQVQVNPAGSSNTGSTGVKVQASLNGVNTQTTYSQPITTINIFLQGGNDNIQLANSLTINAVVTAGDGNDNIQLANGNNTVTLGNGNDNVQAGNGTNTVVAGGGNDNVQLGNGNGDNVTLGNGNDNVQIGNGSYQVVVLGTGNDNVQLGDGSYDTVAVGTSNGSNNSVTLPGTGNRHDNVKFGNGSNNSIK